MTEILAPWTPEQVQHLNTYQQAGWMHPFTCGRRSEHPGDGLLVATEAGWTCPADDCDYQQNWAHDFMTRPPILDKVQQQLANARKERRLGA